MYSFFVFFYNIVRILHNLEVYSLSTFSEIVDLDKSDLVTDGSHDQLRGTERAQYEGHYLYFEPNN